MPFLVVQPTVSQQRTDTTGISLSDSYSVTPISIFNISPRLRIIPAPTNNSSYIGRVISFYFVFVIITELCELVLHWLLLEQYMFILIVVAMRFVIDFIKPILCYVYVTTFCEEK